MARSMIVTLINSVILCLFVVSVAAINDEMKSQYQRYLKSRSNYLEQYKQFIEDRDFSGALATIRKEITRPTFNTNEHLANIRIIGIEALWKYANHHGLKTGMDEEATRYHREGYKFARGNSKTQAGIDHMLALYYDSTYRGGLALPYYRKELEYQKKVNNTYAIIGSYSVFSLVYHELGQLELRDFYLKKALQLAKRYFIPGKHPRETSIEWLLYPGILEMRMDHICDTANLTEIMDLKDIWEPIVNRYVGSRFRNFLHVAQYMARAGEIDRARQLYQHAKKTAKIDGYTDLSDQIALTCNGLHVLLHGGEYVAGARQADQCIKLQFSKDLAPTALHTKIAGLLHERAGNLDPAIGYFRKSIEKYERLRSSHPVTARATFFRSKAREAYWGLIRCFVKRFLTTKDNADFLAALRASELVRSRQFGELLDYRSENKLTLASLAELRRRIGFDEIFLDYMLTKKDIVLFAFTTDRHAAFLVPYDRKEFRQQVLSIVKGLSDPASALNRLHRRLLWVSHRVIDPVRDILRKKRRIVVLPDGILNAVPFDLLTFERSDYRAILEDMSVQVAPSLKYLIPSPKRPTHRREHGLFALADPTYSRVPRIGGLSTKEQQEVDRGSKYLKYFTPLPETRDEVNYIARMFKGEPVKKLLGEGACESVLKRMDLSPYSYLHLATHGILGGDVPGVDEPALVLAEEVGEDGFLTASEAAKLNLDADLAVLSACKTGSGKYFTGEGIMGMSRSFLLAGCRSVLVSLWSVPSIETVQLMGAFYQYLRAKIDLPEALRKAKLEMMRGGTSQVGKPFQDRGILVKKAKQAEIRQVHPFYWGAFISTGKASSQRAYASPTLPKKETQKKIIAYVPKSSIMDKLVGTYFWETPRGEPTGGKVVFRKSGDSLKVHTYGEPKGIRTAVLGKCTVKNQILKFRVKVRFEGFMGYRCTLIQEYTTDLRGGLDRMPAQYKEVAGDCDYPLGTTVKLFLVRGFGR